MGLFCRCVIFMSSLFCRPRHIRGSDRSTFPALVARGTHGPKQHGEKGDRGHRGAHC